MWYKVTVLLVMLLTPVIHASATDRIVSVGGSGSACTLGSPCNLLTAIAASGPGDNVYLRGGQYTTGDINSIPSGTNGSPITISNYLNEAVTLYRMNIKLQNTEQYIVFNGMTFDCDGVFCQIWMIAPVSHITFSNMDIKNSTTDSNSAGMISGNASFLTFKDCKVHNAGFGNCAAFSNQGCYGFYLNGHNNTIDGCEIYQNGGFGIHMYTQSGHGVDDNVVSNNILRNNGFNDARGLGGSGAIVSGGARNSIYNNRAYENRADGISIGVCTDCTAYNNTVVSNTGFGISVSNSTGTIIRNTIGYKNGDQSTSNQIADFDGVATIDHNLLAIDPLFTDEAGHVYTLQAQSTAIDAGTCTGAPSTDANGLHRPQGNQCDEGAYESGSSPPPIPPTDVPAFPTAEGYGAQTIGGRGGRIVRVTSLADNGPGTLRDALEVQTGPRYVLFDVSGTITLTSGPINIEIPNSNVTIAGQTSPGGVQIKGDGVFVKNGAHDVIIRHMRFRPGPHYDSQGVLIGYDSNAFIAYAQNNVPVYNIILDHCDFMWATDQNGPDAFHAVHNMTAQYSIVAEGTNQGHTNGFNDDVYLLGGNHNFGMLMADNINGDVYYSFHHNLIANVGGRAPLIGRVQVVDIRNNIIYNVGGNGFITWGSYSTISSEFGCVDVGSSAFGNFVGNYYISGPADQVPQLSIMNGGPTRLHGNPAERGGSKIYTTDNWTTSSTGWKCPAGCANDWDNFWYNLDSYQASQAPPNPACPVIADAGLVQATEAQFRVGTPYDTPPVTTHSPGQLKALLLPTVGATKPIRDSASTKIVNDVINGTGDVYGVGQGGPWPVLSGGSPPLDTDRDGIPDQWERDHQLNPNNPNDALFIASNGYPNIENYLNELAGDGEVIIPPPPSVSVVHVAQTGGDDGRDCTTAGNVNTPLLTVTKGLQCLTQTSSTMYIHAGLYVENIESAVQFIPSGASWSSPTSIQAFGTDIVTLKLPAGKLIVVKMNNSARDRYIVFDRLILDCNNISGSNGLYGGAGTDHIRFSNGEMKNCTNGSAFLSNTTGYELVRNRLHDSNAWWNMSLFGTNTGTVVTENEIYNNWLGGIELLFGGNNTVTNAVITRNRIHTNSRNFATPYPGIHLGGIGNTGNQVYNNVVYDERAGIELEAGASGSKVYGNTVYGASGVGINVKTGALGTVLTNNIVYGNGGGNIVNNGSNTVQLTNYVVDPLFINPGGGNFNLDPASGAIDTGTNVAEYSVDNVGTTRPQRSIYTIGALEFIGTPNQLPPPLPPSNVMRLGTQWMTRGFLAR